MGHHYSPYGIKKIMRYNEKLYANKFENLDEINKFLQKHSSYNWQIKRENMNKSIFMKEIESVTKILSNTCK